MRKDASTESTNGFCLYPGRNRASVLNLPFHVPRERPFDRDGKSTLTLSCTVIKHREAHETNTG